MKKQTSILAACISLWAMFTLILYSHKAILGATQAMELCIKTLVPTLFPFLVISSICQDTFSGSTFLWCRRLLKPCKFPVGTENIFIIGLLGGYPIGAKLISEAHKNNSISTSDGNRILMFCNNAGPAFIFGIISHFFQENWIPWAIWFIHITSAYIVGVITAQTPDKISYLAHKNPFSITKTVEKSIKTMAVICAWVLLFRIILTFLEIGPLSNLPATINATLTGVIELTNGCMKIEKIKNIGLRFCSALFMITFGGMCVTMQTSSIIAGLSVRQYLLGKLYQSLVASLLALPILIYYL